MTETAGAQAKQPRQRTHTPIAPAVAPWEAEAEAEAGLFVGVRGAWWVVRVGVVRGFLCVTRGDGAKGFGVLGVVLLESFMGGTCVRTRGDVWRWRIFLCE